MTKVKVRLKAVVISISHTYTEGMSAAALYEAGRAPYRLAVERARGAEYAIVTYRGLVLEVYRIRKWQAAGTLKYKTREQKELRAAGEAGKWEFSGAVADEAIRRKYIGKTVDMPRSYGSPIRYANC